MPYTKAINTLISLPATVDNGSGMNNAGSINRTFTGSRTGDKVAEWKRKIAEGFAAGSPYSLDAYKTYVGRPRRDFASHYQLGYPSFKVNQAYYGYPGVRNSVPNPVLMHLSVDTSEARSVALSKIYKKLESDRSEWNALAFLAEFADVIRQFGAPFSAMVEAFERHHIRVEHAKKGLRGRKSWKEESLRRIAAETWLETSFGLLPLFSDAEAIAKAFGRYEYELSDSPKLRDRIRSRAEVSNSTQVTQARVAETSMGVGYSNHVKTETVARCQYVVGLKGDVRAEFGSNNRLLELLGFEPRNIPLAIWEFTPWSWLVDYGLNVQNILQAGATVTTRVNWIVLSQTTTTTLTSIPTLQFVPNGSWPLSGLVQDPERSPTRGPGKGLSAGAFRIIRKTFNRTLPADLGVPPLYLKSPIGDLKKTANLLALATTRLTKSKTWLD
jgi:hypothetical protein